MLKLPGADDVRDVRPFEVHFVARSEEGGTNFGVEALERVDLAAHIHELSPPKRDRVMAISKRDERDEAVLIMAYHTSRYGLCAPKEVTRKQITYLV